MTLEEMQDTLKALGIPHNGWSPAGGQTVASPILEKQKANLRQLKDILEKQIENDKRQVSELHATLQRLKHGGGV